MRNILFFLLLFLSNNVYATTLVIPTTYQTNGVVTNSNLNGNFNAITSIMNGGIDNSNTNTSSGYYLYQTVAALPSYGQQGRVYFLTTDNSLNFDTGSAFTKTVSITGLLTNQVPQYTGSGWNGLTIGTSASNLIQLNGSAQLPAVDGSLLTNTKGPLLTVHATGTQTIVGNTHTTRTFNTVDKDSGGYWTANTYTPLIAGWYLVTYTDAISIGSSGSLAGVEIYKNGSLSNGFYWTVTGSDNVNTRSGTVTNIIQMNGTTDSITFVVYNGNGGFNMTAYGTGYNFASIVRVF